VNFNEGRSVVVAFDHGTQGAIQGGEHLPQMLETIGTSSADGVLLTVGATVHYAAWAAGHQGAAQPIAGLDIPIFGTHVSDSEYLLTTRQPWTAEDAVRAGAAMCKMLLPLGLRDLGEWADALERIARAGADARRIGCPVMLEPAFWGAEEGESDGAILDAARLCVELGADVLKVPSPRNVDTLERLIAWSPVPVVILGGKPRDGDQLIREIHSWVNAGAAGVVVGRNVWNRPNPPAAIEAIATVLRDMRLDDALRLMDQAGTPLSLAGAATHGSAG